MSKRTEKIVETIMTNNFPKLTSDTMLSEEKQRTPSRINVKQTKTTITPSHIIFELRKIKNKEKSQKKPGRGKNLVIDK